MTSRSTRSKSAPGAFGTPQTHLVSQTLEAAPKTSERVEEPTVLESTPMDRVQIRARQGSPVEAIVVHIPVQGVPDNLPPMSPSVLDTPTLSQVNTPHLPYRPLEAPTHIAQAEEAPNWARTSPSQAPLIAPDTASEPLTPFRLPRSVLYQVDSLPGVFARDGRSSWLNPLAKPFVPTSLLKPGNPLAEPFVPASQRENSKPTGDSVHPVNDYHYDDFGPTLFPPHQYLETVPPQHSSPDLYAPTAYPEVFYPLSTDPEWIPSNPPFEPTPTGHPDPRRIRLATYDTMDMYPEHPIGADVKLVKRNRQRRGGRLGDPLLPDVPEPVDSAHIVSPLLCDLGGHKDWEDAVPHLLKLAKRYGVPVPDQVHLLSNSRLQVVLTTIIKILLRHHDSRRPIETRWTDCEIVNPPDTLWLLVHTVHTKLLPFLHLTLSSLRRGCEGTQKGVALALLDRIVVARHKGDRWGSCSWRKRQCERAREHDYQLGVEAGPTDLRRVTWREVVMLLRKERGWTLEQEPYNYDYYGTTF